MQFDHRYGVSFSQKQCLGFGIDAKDTLNWLIGRGWRRFRLMSYWDVHEKTPGEYDFSELDWQLDLVAKAGGTVSLCLGVKQPRWPEYHWPNWAKNMDAESKEKALLKYVEATINHVKHRPEIVSYQLENEALLSNFGNHINIDRGRLRREFNLVKKLDPNRRVIMTASNSWGIPLRQPIPDAVGYSFYKIKYGLSKKRYINLPHFPALEYLRASAVWLLWKRPSFIHELQCEPWGPTSTWLMSATEQNQSMSINQIQKNLHLAQRTKLISIDLWGGEWWYWRWMNGDKSIYQAVEKSLQQTRSIW